MTFRLIPQKENFHFLLSVDWSKEINDVCSYLHKRTHLMKKIYKSEECFRKSCDKLNKKAKKILIKKIMFAKLIGYFVFVHTCSCLRHRVKTLKTIAIQIVYMFAKKIKA